MSKPQVSSQEVNSLIAFFQEKQEKGQNDGIVSARDLLPLLDPTDQTAERIVKVLSRPLTDNGITLVRKGLNFEFHLIPKDTIDQKPMTGKVMAGDDIHCQTNWVSKPTRLNHEFMPDGNYGDIKRAIALGDTVHLVGPPGCGKSICLEKIAQDLKIPFARLSLGGYLDPANLLGDIQLCDAESGQGIITHFVKGILAEMAEAGGMLIFDELDQMDATGNSVFQRITETDGQLIIKTHDKNRPTVAIQKHPMFRMAFTSNTEGHGDITGMFAGVNQQNSSLLDRLNARFFMGYNTATDFLIMKHDYKLPEGALAALFGKTTDSDVDTDCLVAAIRNECSKDNGWRTHLTSRMLMDVASHYAAFNGTIPSTTFSWHKTMLFYFVNKFPVHYRKLVLDMIRAKVGQEFEPTNDPTIVTKAGAQLKAKKFFPNANTFVLPSVMDKK